MVNIKGRINLIIHTRRTVLKVPPKMARVSFWLSAMKPERKETTSRVQKMVSDISGYRLECLTTHRGDDEDDSCPTIHDILGIEILRFV